MQALLSVLSKIGILLLAAAAFVVGLTGTVYLSLLSPEVKVPEVTGKNRAKAEAELSKAGLRMHEKTTRPSKDADPDTILDQSPRPGEVVKVGQAIAVIVSRRPVETASNEKSSEEKEDSKITKKDEDEKDDASSKEKGTDRRKKTKASEKESSKEQTSVDSTKTTKTPGSNTNNADDTVKNNKRAIPTLNQRENPTVP
jgi:beta-lactam-binding protein with PASTA domain